MSRSTSPLPSSASEAVVDVWLPDGDLPAPSRSEPTPVVAVIHGGFWRPEYDRSHCRPLANALAAAGFSVAVLEYRRHPGDPDIAVSDVRRALTTIGHHVHATDSSMVVVGHSAGGHLALLIAADPPHPSIHGVVALAPVADLAAAEEANLGDGATHAFLGVPASTRPDLDPLQRATPAVPTILVHGVWDEVVPIEQSRQYLHRHKSADDEGLHLVEAIDAAHFHLIDPESQAWPRVVEAISTLI